MLAGLQQGYGFSFLIVSTESEALSGTGSLYVSYLKIKTSFLLYLQLKKNNLFFLCQDPDPDPHPPNLRAFPKYTRDSYFRSLVSGPLSQETTKMNLTFWNCSSSAILRSLFICWRSSCLFTISCNQSVSRFSKYFPPKSWFDTQTERFITSVWTPRPSRHLGRGSFTWTWGGTGLLVFCNCMTSRINILEKHFTWTWGGTGRIVFWMTSFFPTSWKRGFTWTWGGTGWLVFWMTSFFQTSWKRGFTWTWGGTGWLVHLELHDLHDKHPWEALHLDLRRDRQDGLLDDIPFQTSWKRGFTWTWGGVGWLVFCMTSILHIDFQTSSKWKRGITWTWWGTGWLVFWMTSFFQTSWKRGFTWTWVGTGRLVFWMTSWHPGREALPGLEKRRAGWSSAWPPQYPMFS